MASRTRQPTALTPITGIVRDSRGEAAARVPVTVRTLSGSGAAERTTITDEVGRFRYQLRPRSRFVLTAELRDEPAARVEIEVHGKSSISLDAGALFTSTAANFATIEVALDDRPPRTKVVGANKRRDAHAQPSRWCCHRAYAVDGAVHARGCLKFDDDSGSEQSGCELYGLKAQVSCHHRSRGGLATGDLSRTERLDCDGRVM